nr:MAG TPA: hypothetical protein [Caudoviricetes sp.]
MTTPRTRRRPARTPWRPMSCSTGARPAGGSRGLGGPLPCCTPCDSRASR